MNPRLSAVALLVPDCASGVDFFVGTLGFDLLTDEDQGDGKRWVTVAPKGGGTALLLAKAVNERQRAAIGNQTGGRVGFILVTDDFAHDHKAMLDAGIDFEEAPLSEPYGIVAVWCDPFGNRWDLLKPTS